MERRISGLGLRMNETKIRLGLKMDESFNGLIFKMDELGRDLSQLRTLFHMLLALLSPMAVDKSDLYFLISKLLT